MIDKGMITLDYGSENTEDEAILEAIEEMQEQDRKDDLSSEDDGEEEAKLERSTNGSNLTDSFLPSEETKNKDSLITSNDIEYEFDSKQEHDSLLGGGPENRPSPSTRKSRRRAGTKKANRRHYMPQAAK